MRRCPVRDDHAKFVFPTTKGSCLENIEVLKQVVEKGEEATTSPEGLSYPKAKRQLERKWTRRSGTVPHRRIYRSRRKGHICKATDSRAMGSAAPWYRRGGTSVESLIPCSHGGRALVIRGRGGGECRGKLQIPRHGGKTEVMKLYKTGVDKFLIKIAENERLRVDAGMLNQETK
ncbi:hypothetical protein GW17_00054403 [Ensete ventricosum]|nr:hypothetical protein GW17_00054403 [Ensete ventricosum]